jgi:hypothetical protein
MKAEHDGEHQRYGYPTHTGPNAKSALWSLLETGGDRFPEGKPRRDNAGNNPPNPPLHVPRHAQLLPAVAPRCSRAQSVPWVQRASTEGRLCCPTTCDQSQSVAEYRRTISRNRGIGKRATVVQPIAISRRTVVPNRPQAPAPRRQQGGGARRHQVRWSRAQPCGGGCFLLSQWSSIQNSACRRWY